MRVISFTMIRDFIAKHADADVALRDWYKRTTKADWNSFADIKQTFNTVDYVGNDRYVFDIKGNNYRIVAIVLFINKKVYMRFVGTHEEYEKKKDNGHHSVPRIHHRFLLFDDIPAFVDGGLVIQGK